MITTEDVEKLVADNMYPETIVLSDADFMEVHRTYRSINRDAGGPYMIVLGTVLRPPGSRPKVVDVSDKNPFGGK